MQNNNNNNKDQRRFFPKKEPQLSVRQMDGMMPPQAIDLEEAVLGAVLLESDALETVMGDFSPMLFYKEQNKVIAESIMDLYAINSAIDILTVTQHLKTKGQLEEVGGAYYISTLTNKVASSSNIEFHIKILQQKHLERFVIKLCSQNINKVLANADDVFDVFSTMQMDMDNALKEVMRYEIQSVEKINNTLISESIKVLESGLSSGVPSGLRQVDNMTNGWQNSDLIILAGRPGSGKTSAALCMAIKPAIEMNIPVLFFSLEMSKNQIVGRIQSYYSEISVSRIIKKQLQFDEIEHISRTCRILDRKPLYIDDTPNISLLELKSKARKMQKEHGIRMVVVDYLQLMRSGMNLQSREQEVAEISKGLKNLAKDLNIPIIALAQLSRQVESRTDKKPLLSDLRESGSLEQDSDMVIFTHRPEYYGIAEYEVDGTPTQTAGLMMLLVEKHRNGAIGEIPVRFIGEYTKIVNYNFGNEDNNTTFVPPENANAGMQENTSFLQQPNSIVSNKKFDEDEPF